MMMATIAEDETRRMFIETAARLFATEVTREVIIDFEKGTWPADLWRKVEGAGLAWVAVPERAGGTGGPYIRAPNGFLTDSRLYWEKGIPYYDPSKVTAPTMLVLAEWDAEGPLYMAERLFSLLVNSPDRRLICFSTPRNLDAARLSNPLSDEVRMPISANAAVKRFMTHLFRKRTEVSPALQEGKVPIPIDLLVEHIKADRCFRHPVFDNWAMSNPDPMTIAALFHQLQLFCSSTRQGWHFPTALKKFGLSMQSKLVVEIVDSESDHGPALAMMAGHIVNRSAGRTICPNIGDQEAVERQLKESSNSIFADSPGYNRDTGLTGQARQAVALFERRKLSDRRSTYKNLGATLALELAANQILIPGMKRCLVDSNLYGVALDEPEMHYLLEHWGEIGAEQQHERKAVAAAATALNESTRTDIVAGIDEFLASLVRLLDVMDEALRTSWLLRCQSRCVCAQLQQPER